MGRVRSSVPRSRVPLHRLVRTNPDVLRRWILVVGLGGFTALLVGRSMASAEAARSRWGETTTVLVTRSNVGAGLPLESRVVARQWPVALAPPGALREVAADAAAAFDLDAGTPITPSAVRIPDVDPRVQVAIPLDGAGPAVSEGDRVDLWSTIDPSLTATVGSRSVVTARVAVGALVTADSSARHVVVAVAVDEAAGVVEALVVATVTPVVVE